MEVMIWGLCLGIVFGGAHADDTESISNRYISQALQGDLPGGTFILGSETGYSVREVVQEARQVTGCDLAVDVGPRRGGEPPSLVASSKRIREELGWKPGLGQ